LPCMFETLACLRNCERQRFVINQPARQFSPGDGIVSPGLPTLTTEVRVLL
jgi:hypothetical protein